MKRSLIIAAATAAIAVSGAAFAHGDPYGMARVVNGHFVTAKVAASYHNKVAVSGGLVKVAAHTYSNLRAEKPVSCSNLAAKAGQPLKWDAFCGNGGGGR